MSQYCYIIQSIPSRDFPQHVFVSNRWRTVDTKNPFIRIYNGLELYRYSFYVDDMREKPVLSNPVTVTHNGKVVFKLEDEKIIAELMKMLILTKV